MYSLLVHSCIVLPRYVENHVLDKPMLNMLSSRNKDTSLYIIVIISMGIKRRISVTDS